MSEGEEGNEKSSDRERQEQCPALDDRWSVRAPDRKVPPVGPCSQRCGESAGGEWRVGLKETSPPAAMTTWGAKELLRAVTK